MPKERIVILGAGLSGLTCAYYLKKDYEIFEKEKEAGGLCRSKKIDGFIFDYSGHLLHFRKLSTLRFIQNLLPNNLLIHRRNSSIRIFNTYIPYPFQLNFLSLPKKRAYRCFLDLIKAKMKSNAEKSSSFYDWLIDEFGRSIAYYFMIPYNQKFWKVSLYNMRWKELAKFIPSVSLEDIATHIFSLRKKEIGYNVYFWYPKKGGIFSLIEAISQRIKKIHFGFEAKKIDIKKKTIKFKNGEIAKFTKLIYTAPLPELRELIPNLSKEIRKSLSKLKYISIFNLNLGLKQKNISRYHWIYFPERKFVFYRVGFYHNFSPYVCPLDKSSLYVEVSYLPNKSLTQNISTYIINDLVKANIISKNSIITQDINNIKYGYIIYDSNYPLAIQKIKKFLIKNDIYPCGRYGSWKYMCMEDTILSARQLIHTIC